MTFANAKKRATKAPSLFPTETTPADWKWKAENFVRWVESGVLLKDHDSRVEFLAGEYSQIYSQGVIAGRAARR